MASVPEATNGHADPNGAVPGDGHRADKPRNGHTAKANGSSSNGTGAGSTGAPGQAQPRAEASRAGSPSGNGHVSVAEFTQLRNEVLSLARRLSGVSKREISAVMSWSSEGAFQYSDIGRLTPADLPKLKSGLERLKNAATEPRP